MGCGIWAKGSPQFEPLETEKIHSNGSSHKELKIKSSAFIKKQNTLLHDNYLVLKKLGEGAYGSVHLGTKKDWNIKRAIKSIRRKNMNKLERTKFINEVMVLKNLDHPNVMKVFEFYEEQSYFHLVCEYCSGGELFDYIIENQYLSEYIAAEVMIQVLQSIAYCHSQNIVHRDLKPENLLISKEVMKPTDPLVIKIADFGTSVLIQEPNEMLKSKVGTPFYIAPEVLSGRYNEKCDVWSAGVILFILLVGYPPFTGVNEEEIIQQVKRAKLHFSEQDWAWNSKASIALVRRMLTKNPKARPTAEELLKDEWFALMSQSAKREISISTTAMDSMMHFQADRKLQTAVVSYITSQLMAVEDLPDIEKTFKQIDVNNDGKLSREELHVGFSEYMSVDLSNEELDDLMNKADVDRSGYIDYSEFITVASNRSKILSSANLRRAFEAFDADRSGSITKDEILAMLGRTNCTAQVCEKIIKEVDLDGNGEIDMKEFESMMLRLF